MQPKSLCVTFAIFTLLSFSISTHASYSIESEPSHDPFRDGSSYAYASNDSDDDAQEYSEAREYEYRRQAYNRHQYSQRSYHHRHSFHANLPSRIASTGEKIIIVSPKAHAWGAYGADGRLIRSGLASAGANWCPDLGRPCRTKSGMFRIQAMGDESCISKKFPVGEGGAPMPFCMYFNGGIALHGSHELAEANISHGCVRMNVGDAEWLRYNFAHVGTKVVVTHY